ncbi:hypothetical protein REPUB_Repub16aG0108100 [Reevesia pubescens]
MKVVALVSGGKDSCHAMMKCIQSCYDEMHPICPPGFSIVALANLLPADDSVDELDSYMYQTNAGEFHCSEGEFKDPQASPINDILWHQKLSYQKTPGDEVEAMFILLNEVKKQIPSVTAVSSGAIASDYQRLWVESVCSRIQIVYLTYYYLVCPIQITNGLVAILVKVAAMWLDPAKHLGKEIAFLKPYLHKLKDLYGINVCGEGGEYETLTLDRPLFHVRIFQHTRIILDEFKVVLHSADSIAPVGVLHPSKFHLERKAFISLIGNDKTVDPCWENINSVFEVQGENPNECKAPSKFPEVGGSVEVSSNRLHLSKTEKDNTFSICCWLQDPSEPSAAKKNDALQTLQLPSRLQEDLKLILRQTELQLLGCGFGWEEILHMAGQLGLNPPTMTLCGGGPTAELEQALQNSEATAQCFNCLISTSAILFVVYCSTNIPSDERPKIHDKLETALVEVKPILFVPETTETTEETLHDHSGKMAPSYYGFQPADWHESCIQKCIIHGKICAVVLSITSAIALKISSDSMNADWSNGNHRNSVTEGQMKRISRFCIYLLDKIVSK